MAAIERKPGGTREALLDAATTLFSERGYRAVSTRDLAEAAGANLAAIQYHFGSKAKLFVEVVHSLMEGSGCVESRLALSLPIQTVEDAAHLIGDFVCGFLGYLLDSVGPKACPMMLREVLTDHSEDPEMIEALVSSVSEKFMKPMQETLERAVAIIAPQYSSSELELCARSITGQCTFYPSHRPFIERLNGASKFSETGMRDIAAHIISFSLRGLRCPEEIVERVVAKTKEVQFSSTRK